MQQLLYCLDDTLIEDNVKVAVTCLAVLINQTHLLSFRKLKRNVSEAQLPKMEHKNEFSKTKLGSEGSISCGSSVFSHLWNEVQHQH